METFAKARRRLLLALMRAGWTVALNSERAPWKPLKVPHATRGDLRLWFKPQALYLSNGGRPFFLKDAGSLTDDIRELQAETLFRWLRPG